MRFKVIALVLTVATGLVLAGVAIGETRWWQPARGGYQLPAAQLKQAVEEVLTDHRLRLDAIDAQVASNAAALATHMTSGDHDSRYVRDDGEDLRILRGLVLPNGLPNSQPFAGFTVTKGPVGTYTITPNTPFSGIPALIVDSRGNRNVCGFSLGPGSATFTICNSAGVAFDSEFRFVLVGGQ